MSIIEILKRKRISIFIFNFIIFFSIFVFLLFRYKYAIVKEDDLIDLLCNKLHFYHGRYVSLLIQYFFVVGIPKFFNIPIQNFAFFSEGVCISVIFMFLIHTVAASFFQHIKINYFLGCLYLLIFFYSIYMALYLEACILYTCNAFCYTYFISIPIFLVFWLKLLKYNSESIQEIKKKDIFFLALLAFILPQLNEFVGLCTFILLVINKKKFPFLKIPSIICFLTFCIILFSPDFWQVIRDHSIQSNVKSFEIFSLVNIKDFLYGIYKCLIDNNKYLILTLLFLLSFLIVKNNTDKTKNIIKFFGYTYLSFFIFFLSLYFVGDINNYKLSLFNDIRPFFVTYFSLLYQLKFFIFASILYLCGYIISLDIINNNIYKKFTVYILVVLFIAVNIISFNKVFYLNDDYKENKKFLYVLDKISVFYLKQGKTAILPRSDIYKILPRNVMPADLDQDNFSKQVHFYERFDHIGQMFYLKYLEKEYNVDIELGMTFRNDDEAINTYLKNGGTLTDYELEHYDFRKIRFTNLKKQ